MREKNRKPIASIKKLPQFTTMNVIDGQAGLVIYSSLIFYSLTLDNILNIIVLLILAGVTIAALSGDNGILQNAAKAKEETEQSSDIEKIKILITFFDAVGLGVFCVTGTAFAMQLGFSDNMLLCVASGLITSIVGGMLRDVLANRKPVVLRKEIYAVAAIIGAVIYYLIEPVIGITAATYLVAFLVLVIRMYSVRHKINMLVRIRNVDLHEIDDDDERHSEK